MTQDAQPLSARDVHERTTHSLQGAPFDLDSGKFSMSTRAVVAILVIAFVSGGGVVSAHWRQSGTEAAVASLKTEVQTGFDDLRQEMAEDRARAQTLDKAFTDCLLIERANPKTFKCPLAPPIVIERTKPLRPRRISEPAPSSMLNIFGTANAKAVQRGK